MQARERGGTDESQQQKREEAQERHRHELEEAEDRLPWTTDSIQYDAAINNESHE